MEKIALTNKNGSRIEVSDLGALWLTAFFPDRDGVLGDVVLGFDSLEEYERDEKGVYFGATTGRYANRIKEGRFSIDGTEHQLSTNLGRNHLHGGVTGFNRRLWEIEERTPQRVRFSYLSTDGEEGYPGNLSMEVTYTLDDENAVHIVTRGRTDAPTIVNVTNHSYFNLGMDDDICGHELKIYSDRIAGIDGELIADGTILPVAKGGVFDFSDFKNVCADIDKDDPILKYGGGYDVCYIFGYDGLKLMAELYHGASGRLMETWSDQKALQFYSGNAIAGGLLGKGGRRYHSRSGLCLETQAPANSPNIARFPSVVLRPGETYSTTTIYKFKVK